MQNVRPIITHHNKLNKAESKSSHRDPLLDTCSKIYLKKINKTGLQDNYLWPFDVIARSEKYLTIRLNDGKFDNVTVERVKPCFSQADTLPCPAVEQQHEVHIPASPGYQAPQLLPAPTAPPAHPAPPAREEPYRTCYERVSRKPDQFMFKVYKDIYFFSTKTPGKGGDVAHATWHYPSCYSQEQQQLLSDLRATF